MALESGTYISDLNVNNPVGSTDPKAQGDDHIKLIKAVLKNTFPGAAKPTYIQQARADVASAATTNLGAATTDYVNITGTTTITSFGTATAGIRRRIRFDGALTLTHNGTSLILPGAANIVTVAGDHASATSLGSGNWVVENYHRASGKALILPSASEFETLFLTLISPFLIGVSLEWNGALADIPNYCLPEDGRAVSRSTYSDLFDKIGVLHGVGNGSTTFNLPDTRGCVVANLDDMGTAAGAADVIEDAEADTVGDFLGAATHTLTEAQLAAHKHFTIADENAQGGSPDVTAENQMRKVNNQGEANQDSYELYGSAIAATLGLTSASGGGEAHNNLQPTRFKHRLIFTGVSNL